MSSSQIGVVNARSRRHRVVGWSIVAAVGLLVGILPGLGGIAGMSILLPFIYGMDTVSALALLIGLLAVVPTGDTFTSVLMGIPGSAASQATILDGFPMAKRGEAARALSAAFFSSMLGGIVGALVLTAFILVARPVILAFSSAELFMLTLLGLAMVGVLSGSSFTKGLLSCALGLLLGFVGAAPATGEWRLVLGLEYLVDGLPLVVVAFKLAVSLILLAVLFSRIELEGVRIHLLRKDGSAFHGEATETRLLLEGRQTRMVLVRDLTEISAPQEYMSLTRNWQSSIGIQRQLHYVQHSRLGFDKEQVLVINTRDALGKQGPAFKQALAQVHGEVDPLGDRRHVLGQFQPGFLRHQAARDGDRERPGQLIKIVAVVRFADRPLQLAARQARRDGEPRIAVYVGLGQAF